jgi:uncharacterized protein
MRVRYDPAKAAANLKAHDVSFEEAEAVLFDPTAVTAEDPDAMGEHRYVSVGRGDSGRILVVVFTEQDDEYRLISARRPTRKERKCYEG